MKKEYEKILRKIKKDYGRCCAVTGRRDTTLIGSHIFPRGAYPQFKNLYCNILPVIPIIDQLIEYSDSDLKIMRNPFNRILLISRLVKLYDGPFIDQVLRQLNELCIVLREYKKIHGWYR